MITKYIKGAINITIIPILATILLLGIYKTSTDPKTGIMIITISTIIISIILAYSYLSKSKTKYNIGQFIAITLNIILIFSIYNINKDYKYIENTFSNNYNYLKNNVYVLKSTKYKSSNQLSNKKIGILKNNSNNTTPIITKNIKDIEIVWVERVEDKEESLRLEAEYFHKHKETVLNDRPAEEMDGGGNPRSRSVICLNDGKIFDTITECANYYGKGRSTITRVLQKVAKHTYVNDEKYYFEYYNGTCND